MHAGRVPARAERERLDRARDLVLLELRDGVLEVRAVAPAAHVEEHGEPREQQPGDAADRPAHDRADDDDAADEEDDDDEDDDGA